MAMNNTQCEVRRRFLKVSVTAATLVLSGGVPSWLFAAELPRLSEDDATAKMLGYVEDATKAKDSRFKAGQKCSNCQLYAGGPTGYGPCQLFPGKGVNADGWCTSYMPKKA